jgi:hypothetical protein
MASMKKLTVRFNGCGASAIVDISLEEHREQLKSIVAEALDGMLDTREESDSISVTLSTVRTEMPESLFQRAKHNAAWRKEQREDQRMMNEAKRMKREEEQYGR